MSDHDVIEAHALHRRRVLAAFLWGRDRGARSVRVDAVRSLLLGLGLALLIAVVVGVVALAGVSRQRSPHAQAPPVSPQAEASTAAS